MPGYAERAKARREDLIFRFPEGEYKGILRGVERNVSRNKGTVSIRLIIRPTECPTPEVLDKALAKKRMIHMDYWTHVPAMINDACIMLENAEYDLSTELRPEEKDPNFEDFFKLFRDMEEERSCRFSFYLKPNEEDVRFYNLRKLKIESIEPRKTSTSHAAPVAPSAPAGDPTAWYLDSAGNVGQTTKSVLIGWIEEEQYSGQVCVDGATWVDSSTVATPKPKAPAAPAAPQKPEAPVKPEAPAAPVKPEAPQTPEKPAAPTAPSVPPKPVMPN